MLDMIIAKWRPVNVADLAWEDLLDTSVSLLMEKLMKFITTVRVLVSDVSSYNFGYSEFRTTQKGECGITLNSGWAHPEDPENPDDILASQIAMSLYLGWWAYPIYGSDGDYLKLMKDTLSDAGEWNQAWNLSEDEKNMLKDSSGSLS